MKIQSVHIRNYRKLKNSHIDFGEKETVLVGANNSGKTSAISAIVGFLKNTDRFTLKEFTATNWALINEIGEKWLENDSVDEALLSSHQWDTIVPSMDVWINVEDGEQYRVNHLIPSLSTWDGKKVGVRGQYGPKDVKKLYTAYKEAKTKANILESTEEWKKAGSPELYPRNLCDFLGKGLNLKEYFNVKYYIIDPALDPVEEDKVQETPDHELDSNPFESLIRVDTILASRDFSDPGGQSDSDIDTLSKQFQQYYKSCGLEDEELTSEGLNLLGGIAIANKTYDEKLRKTFEMPVGELKNINYPGFQNPEIKIRSKIQIEEAIKHDSAVQFAIQGMEQLVLPEKYNGLGYRNLISIYMKLIDFREKWLRTFSDGENIEPIHIVFVEEPEAHLHAQAQQVFHILEKFFRSYPCIKLGSCQIGMTKHFADCFNRNTSLKGYQTSEGMSSKSQLMPARSRKPFMWRLILGWCIIGKSSFLSSERYFSIREIASGSNLTRARYSFFFLRYFNHKSPLSSLYILSLVIETASAYGTPV